MKLSSTESRLASIDILGAKVDALPIRQLNALITQAVAQKRRWIIANHNLHSLYVYHHDPRMRSFYQKSDFIHIDGMALILLGNLLGYSLHREHRVTYVDWLPALMSEAVQQQWRIFYLGSKPEVVQHGAAILRNQFPGLKLITAHGYFDPDPSSFENQAILKSINAYQPHILMIGMGMPRQEHWILDNINTLQANAILTCGAAIDYVAGAIPTPPRWSGKLGLEWLFRLIAEPRRLGKRYLIEPWFILKLLLIKIARRFLATVNSHDEWGQR
jgi:N-acetylglucosaminyldiphosphoundecaprenol N-acetyl-beta-D-mannosaminyltransferase